MNEKAITRTRKSIGIHFSMCVQPSFIIGTNNEDGSYNFAPITWVSAACEKDDYLIVMSIFSFIIGGALIGGLKFIKLKTKKEKAAS